MRKRHATPIAIASLCWVLLFTLTSARAADQADVIVAPRPTLPLTQREIYVPFDDLPTLLAQHPKHVMLPRERFEQLLAAANAKPEASAPIAATVSEASYRASLFGRRAIIEARLVVDALAPGLHAIPLPLAGVTLREAKLDGQPAPIAARNDGQIILFVEGPGRSVLTMQLIAPITTETARQVLAAQLPTPGATTLHLEAPGDVEVESGLAVIDRTFDPQADVTRFELLPRAGEFTLSMTLNSRLKRSDRLVVARSVIVPEVTRAYEKLHATLSFGVLHRAVEQFSIRISAGFEVSEVATAQLARWTVVRQGEQRILHVTLRKPTTDDVVIALAAVRRGAPRGEWALPRLEPLEVVSHVAVVGLLVEDEVSLEALDAHAMMSIDADVLRHALPASVFSAGPFSPQLRPVGAWYSPGSDFGLSAAFTTAELNLNVATHGLLVISDAKLELHAGLTLHSSTRAWFEVDVMLPEGWSIDAVTDADDRELAFEPLKDAEAPQGRRAYRIRLNAPAQPGDRRTILLDASHIPDNWFDRLAQLQDAEQPVTVTFPRLTVGDSSQDRGAIAIATEDDLTVLPHMADRLSPLDEKDKPRYGLGGVASDLAYRYEDHPYRAAVRVGRAQPRLSARAFQFFQLAPDVRTCHYEVNYHVSRAGVDTLSFRLPASTPSSLTVRAIGDIELKGYRPLGVDDGMRTWLVELSRKVTGSAGLAVSFTQRTPDAASDAEIALPMIEPTGPSAAASPVAIPRQSGLIAIEGDAELSVRVIDPPRQVDVGELAVAQYQPGKRLLGVYEYVGAPPALAIEQTRYDTHPLPPAIVQAARLTTVAGAAGVAQTMAQFELKTRALFIEIHLPAGAALWSVELDGRPLKPQVDPSGVAVVDIAEADTAATHTLRLAYESTLDAIDSTGSWTMQPPTLAFRTGKTGSIQVPVMITRWQVHLPPESRLISASGMRRESESAVPELALWTILRRGYAWSGGLMGPVCLPSLGAARDGARDTTGYSRLEQREEERSGATSEFGLEDAPAAAEPQADLEAMPQGQAPMAPEDERGVAHLPRSQRKDADRLIGHRSLSIALNPDHRRTESHTFVSLANAPRLELTVTHETKRGFLGWGAAAVVMLLGLAQMRRSAGACWRFIAVVVVVSTLGAALISRDDLVTVLNMAVYAAVALAVLNIFTTMARVVHARWSPPRPAPATVRAAALLACLLLTMGAASAEENDDDRLPAIQIPPEALIVPYDPETVDARGVPPRGDSILVPLDQYTQLWHLAGDDRVAPPPPVRHAWAGAQYRARLVSDGDLQVTGQLTLDVFTDDPVMVPLPLENGVLAEATIDGEEARLGVLAPAADQPNPPIAMRQAAPRRAVPMLALHVSGRGRHEVAVTIRMKLDRQGGWREVDGRIPAAAATALDLLVPDARTELLIAGVTDQNRYETDEPDQRIRTALQPNGRLSLRWRPRVDRDRSDLGLMAESIARLDLQEDQVRLTWHVALQFAEGRRQQFELRVPEDYLVEHVAGTNVQGWELSDEGEARRLRVAMLSPAEGSERFTVQLRRPGRVGVEPMHAFDVPVLRVAGTAVHRGRLLIRRSPLLDVRTEPGPRVTRIDLPDSQAVPLETGQTPGPIGLKPHEAYEFVAAPFKMGLQVKPIHAVVTAGMRSILRVAEIERSLEMQMQFYVHHRAAYRFQVVIPEHLELQSVVAPEPFEWAEQRIEGRRVITIWTARGQRGRVPVGVSGVLDRGPLPEQIPLPQVDALNARMMSGAYIAVLADPGLQIATKDLELSSTGSIRNVGGWLKDEQQKYLQTVIVIARPDYSGTLTVARRTPRVTSRTISNVRVTRRQVEQTILASLSVKEAGIRTLEFLIPERLRDAHIQVPRLRRKLIRPAEDREGWLHVTLELQDEIIGDVRVLIEENLPLTDRAHHAVSPVMLTGETLRQFITLENVGRDELVLGEVAGVDPLSRQQREWRELAKIIGDGAVHAFVASGDHPTVPFTLRQRQRVQTSQARIGLAQAMVTIDPTGAYRGRQVFFVDNSTEPHLELKLPEGASLLTVTVAGQPVKPARAAGTPGSVVRIALVKTAAGEDDYPVNVQYIGDLGALGTSEHLEMPLIRSTNINVELSQVRLRLPTNYHWFDFGGTMRQVTDDADLIAGVIRYQTRQLKRTLEAARQGSAFSKARAEQNLWKTVKELEEFDEDANQPASNAEVRQLRESQVAVIDELRETIAQQQQVDSASEVAIDHRRQLNDFYAGQYNEASSNAVRGLSSNFETPAATTSNGVTISDVWLGEQKLDVKSNVAEAGAAGSGTKSAANVDRSVPTASPDTPQNVQFDRRIRSARDGSDVSGKKLALRAGQSGERDEREGGAAKARGQARDPQPQAEAVQQYRQRLERSQRRDVASPTPSRPADDKPRQSASERLERFREVADPGRGPGAIGGWSDDSEAPIASGLVSLDVQIEPIGREYRFTLPSGEVRLTARAAAESTTGYLLRLLTVIVVLLVAAWAIRRVLRVDPALWRSTGFIAGLLAVGTVSALLGMLPVAGVLLVLTAITLFVLRQVGRPA